jgi:hypothetical protein
MTQDEATDSTQPDLGAQELIRTADAADAEKAAELTEDERKAQQEAKDLAYAHMLADQYAAEEARRVADAVDAVDAGNTDVEDAEGE